MLLFLDSMKYAKVDLHVHFDGSLDLKWQYERAKLRNVISENCTYDEYAYQMYRNDYPSREKRMKRFDIPLAVLQTKEDLYDGIYDLLRYLNDLGLVYVEIRFAPQLHCLNGLSQYEVVESLCEGMRKANEDFMIRSNLICCLMHKGDSARCNHQENVETIEVTKHFLGKGVVALDLAGYENNCPFEEYGYLFEMAKEYDIPYTIHCGEMGKGEHVPLAIQMGASRLGHGVQCVQNDAWVQEVIDTQIPLEVCVSSNCYDNKDFKGHPIHQLLKMGAKVTINSDNMNFIQTNVVKEYELLAELGLTEEVLKQCMLNAIECAFCNEETREWIYEQVCW